VHDSARCENVVQNLAKNIDKPRRLKAGTKNGDAAGTGGINKLLLDFIPICKNDTWNIELQDRLERPPLVFRSERTKKLNLSIAKYLDAVVSKEVNETRKRKARPMDVLVVYELAKTHVAVQRTQLCLLVSKLVELTDTYVFSPYFLGFPNA
jgi:hypothetical protein